METTNMKEKFDISQASTDKNEKFRLTPFDRQMLVPGRWWYIGGILLISLVPIVFSLYYGYWPKASEIIKPLISVWLIYGPIGAIESFTYIPMIGVPGTYLSFLTGNVSNLKIPAAMNATMVTKTDPDTQEGKLISTIAMTISALVTVLVLALGVLVMAFTGLDAALQSDVLTPAFNNVLAALFGAMGLAYIMRDWKIAIAPLAFEAIIFIFLRSSKLFTVSITVPLCAIISIVVARMLFKKGHLAKKAPAAPAAEADKEEKKA